MPNVDPYVDQVMEAIDDASSENSMWSDQDLRTRVRQALVDAADHGAAQREQLVEGLLASDHNVEIDACPPPEGVRHACPYADGSCCVHPQAVAVEHVKPLLIRRIGERVPSFCPLHDQPTRLLLAEGV